MSEVYSLDLETTPLVKSDKPYALEPFRFKQGLAAIDSAAVCTPDDTVIQLFRDRDGDQSLRNLPDVLRMLSGKIVAAHFAVFDVAWLLESEDESLVRNIRWRDTSTMAKWIINGQKAERPKMSYSLDNLISLYLRDHPLYGELHKLKGMSVAPGEDPEYWARRGELDAIMTRHLYEVLWNKMPHSMVNGFELESRAIVPVAKSWNHGIPLNVEKTKELLPKINRAKTKIAAHLDIPQSVFTSPKQLSRYLFDVLGLQPLSTTDSGAPSTKADDLKMMLQMSAGTKTGEILKAILDFKQLNTLKTKFIDGILKTSQYVGEPSNHSAPRMFSTYTGRFSYSSKTQDVKFKPGIAVHQLPRKGPTRSLLHAPEGFIVGELDAAAQEMRGMAIESLDPELIQGFNLGLDLHAGMGADISGDSYEDFVELYKSGDDDTINYRYAGKLLNLSCQYRIGAPALTGKFFSTYGIVISRAQSQMYLNAYKKRYKGVEQYWTDAISKAKELGYAETVSGRRFYLTDWGRFKWATESSAINFPIQGFGADHKVVAIAEVYHKFPEANFLLDLHDGLWYMVPELHGKELLLDMKSHLSGLDYGKLWGRELPVQLPFDAQLGTNFGNVKEI